MGDSLRYKDWFEKAAHDLRGAEILMEHDGGNDLEPIPKLTIDMYEFTPNSDSAGKMNEG